VLIGTGNASARGPTARCESVTTRRPDPPISVLHPAARPATLGRKKIAKLPTVAGILRQIAREGFSTVKNVETDHGMVEYVVSGPTGVFAVTPKTWRRHVWVGAQPARVMVGRSEVTDSVRQAVRQAHELERRARRDSPGTEVMALIVVTGTRLPAGPLALGRATVVDIEQLADAVTSGAPSIDVATARVILDAVSDPSNVVTVSFGTD